MATTKKAKKVSKAKVANNTKPATPAKPDLLIPSGNMANGVRMKVPPVKNPFAIDNVNNKDCSTRASIQVVMLDPVI